MNRFHGTVLALLLAAAAVLGAVAVTRTTHLGAAATNSNSAAITARTKQLAAYAAKLRQELRARPPALPRVPKTTPLTSPAPVSRAAPRIVYQQPPPVVVTLHHHGDDGNGGGDDGGGGGGGDG